MRDFSFIKKDYKCEYKIENPSQKDLKNIFVNCLKDKWNIQSEPPKH